MELLKKANGNIIRTDLEKSIMIEKAAMHYGNFLRELGYDWEADPHSSNTPTRVAKAWINDLAAGSNNALCDVTAFPNDAGLTGLICQTWITVTSMCAHHNLPFTGIAHVAYIPGKKEDDKIVGLSKLNRIVDWVARRPSVQESLTKDVHTKVNELCAGNRGVAVIVMAQHSCVKCRGIRDASVMATSELSGYFFTNQYGTRQELFFLIDQSSKLKI